ncbi:MAG: TIGR02221 family CRISPR-associated protein [Microcoleaceae cyanobacterium]
MAKILISPLGTGSLDRNNIAAREYRKANYKINDQCYERTFFSSVLYENLNLDGIIFIGTVKSMWEEVYRFFSEAKNLKFDEEYWFKLIEQIEKLDYQSSPDSLDLSEVEKILGERSKCISIEYGLNETELWHNFDRIIKIIDFLEDGDEIYIDITHSFRSLSIFMFLVMTFLNDLSSEKNIQIKGVYYGMLDVVREIGYAPVVNLQPVFDLTKWIKGAYSLKNFGNGYLISQLLQEQGETLLAKEITQLSDAININYLPAIKQRANYLKSQLQPSTSSNPFKYLKNILDKFIKQFTSASERESDFQLKLAGWYFENKRYATGYITLTEAIITYVCEIQSQDSNSQTQRNQMKEFLHLPENNKRELAKLYFDVNPIRKSIAHALINEQRESYAQAIKNANNYHQKAKQIFKTRTLGNL